MLTLTPENTIIYQTQRDDNAYYAATWLRDKLRFAYGVTEGFEVVTRAPTYNSNKVVILIGPNEKEVKLDPYGFHITKRDNFIQLYGKEYEPGMNTVQQNNLLNAVTYFLDVHCGIRQYIPSDDWCVRLKAPVELKDTINEKINPIAQHTYGTGIGDTGGEAYLWGRAHGYYSRLGDTHQHTIGYLQGGDANPDIADPDVLVKAKAWIGAYFYKNNAPYVSLTIMDTDVFPDTEHMRKAIQKLGSVTEVMLAFVRRLSAYMAKHHKGKKLIHLAYASVNLIPRSNLPSNVVSVLVQRIAELDAKGSLYPSDYQNPASIPDWLDVSREIGIHDWAQGRGYLIPRLYTSQYHKLFNYLISNREKLYYLYMECYPNYGLDGPKYWLMHKLNMDPTADYWKLMLQFCEDMFGEAAYAMYGYFRNLEALSLSMQNNLDIGLKKMFGYWGQFKMNQQEFFLLNLCQLYLQNAVTIASTDSASIERKRISFLARSFNLSYQLLWSQYAESVPKGLREQIIAQAELVHQDQWAFYHNLEGSLVDQVKAALDATMYMKPITQ